MNAPVVLFAYNRPYHLQQTIDALRHAQLSDQTDLIIFSDAPRTIADSDAVAQVRTTIRNICGFATIKIVERRKNVGLASNIIDGLTSVFEQYDRAIVLEDDIVPSEGFLQYMNDALSFYEDKNVWSVAGYTPQISVPSSYAYSTYLAPRNCSWGWATWRAKWLKTNWQVPTFDQFIRSRQARHAFNQAGTDLSAMLLRWRIGEINSWSIRFCYAAFCHNELTVYPTASLVVNIGADGTGTNVSDTSRYESQTINHIDKTRFAPPTVGINSDILQSFRKTYNCSFIRRCINHLKLLLYIIQN